MPRIADVTSFGGTVKRYEIHPDPDRLQRYGITLAAIAKRDGQQQRQRRRRLPLPGARSCENVRSIGLIGGGLDPMQSKRLFEAKDSARGGRLPAQRREPPAPRDPLDRRRLGQQSARQGRRPGRRRPAAAARGNRRRRAWSSATRRGSGRWASAGRSRDEQGRELQDADGNVVWIDEDDKVQSIVLLRQHEQSLPALHDVKEKVKELNENPGQLLPGVKIEPYYDRTELIDVTTETVRENLLVGMVLVVAVLLMFLSNVRTALIVAINIPLALLFAFAMLFLRGKSANLLSIGAVDFGIIVDSSVIMVENIYRHLSAGETSGSAAEGADPPRDRRDRPAAVVLDGDHGLRLPAAVHDARSGRADLRPDGRDLRLRPGRRAAAGGAARAGAVPAASCGSSSRRRTTSWSAG